MYEQRRREVNKEFDKYQKQMKIAKKSGSKSAADKVCGGGQWRPVHCSWSLSIRALCVVSQKCELAPQPAGSNDTLHICVSCCAGAAPAQVEKGAKAKQARKSRQQGGPSDSGGGGANPDAPRQWNDYNVHFHFPEPTELPPPLLQLIDAR